VSGERLISELVAFVEANRTSLSNGQTELALNPTCLRYLTQLDAQLSGSSSSLTPLRQRECRALLLFIGTLKLLRIVPTHAGAVDKLTEFQLAPFRSLAAVEISSVKLGLVADWRRVATQLRLVIVRDCLSSLDELLAFDDDEDAAAAVSAGAAADRPDHEAPVAEPWAQLQQLSCAENFIPRMDASLHALTRLERLDLSHNLIGRIEHTEHCYNLGYLNLGNNRIESISDINLVLGNVSVLILRDNQLSSMLGLEKLFNLRRLDLAGNRLADLSELRELGTLPVLEQLWLARNPFTAAANYRSAVFCAFQQDLVLDGRSPTDSERRERADERELRAAAAVARAPRTAAQPGDARSQPVVVVARRKHAHAQSRQRSARKPAIAVVVPSASAPASASASSPPPPSAAPSLVVSPPRNDVDELLPVSSTGTSGEPSPESTRRASSSGASSIDFSLDALDRMPASPAQQTAYLQELRKEGGAAWLLMMEELSSGQLPDTPAVRNALLTRLSAKTKTLSLSRIILPTPAAAPASLATPVVGSSASAKAGTAPSSPRQAEAVQKSATDENGDDDDDDRHDGLSRFASMPPSLSGARFASAAPTTVTAAAPVAAAPAAARVTLADLADTSEDAGGGLCVLGVDKLDDALVKSLLTLLRKDGDASELRALLRSNGLLGKSDDEQRLHVLLTQESLCVFRGEPPSLYARVPLLSLSRLTVALSHQFCALRYASGDALTLLLRDSSVTARWLKQLSLATARLKHQIDGESAAAESALVVQRDVLGDSAEPIKLFVMLFRVVPGAKRFGGWLPDGVTDPSVQPVSLVVSRNALAIFVDAYGRGSPAEVVRFAISDVASLVLDQTSTGFTIVFDEQAEPQPKRDKSAWRRATTLHRWTLVTQTPAERDKAVAVIAAAWKRVFKIDLL
jgi:hypothetical protein